MKQPEQLTAEEQTKVLAERYSQRAAVYDELWSPVIRPMGERLLDHLPLAVAEDVIDVGTGAGALIPRIRQSAPTARVLGVDRSEGMLRLARSKHNHLLALMDVQGLAVVSDQFDVAIVAFVLFHLPDPERCLEEVRRVLKAGGAVGTVTWGAEYLPGANAIWDEELEAAGASVQALPATENRGCCDSKEKMVQLLKQTGFASTNAWNESLEYRWRAEEHFEYHVGGSARVRLQSLNAGDRAVCLRRVRERTSHGGEDQYVQRAELVMATAVK